MKTVIHEPFGNVLYRNAAGFPDGRQVHNALVCHQAVIPGIDDRIVFIQPLGDVVRVQDGNLGCPPEA